MLLGPVFLPREGAEALPSGGVNVAAAPLTGSAPISFK